MVEVEENSSANSIYEAYISQGCRMYNVFKENQIFYL